LDAISGNHAAFEQLIRDWRCDPVYELPAHLRVSMQSLNGVLLLHTVRLVALHHQLLAGRILIFLDYVVRDPVYNGELLRSRKMRVNEHYHRRDYDKPA
jgi:hypothetical protein